MSLCTGLAHHGTMQNCKDETSRARTHTHIHKISVHLSVIVCISGTNKGSGNAQIEKLSLSSPPLLLLLLLLLLLQKKTQFVNTAIPLMENAVLRKIRKQYHCSDMEKAQTIYYNFFYTATLANTTFLGL